MRAPNFSGFAGFRRLHRLAIHDDDRRTSGPTGLPSSLLVHCALDASPDTTLLKCTTTKIGESAGIYFFLEESRKDCGSPN
jgi:hypothetical protein